LVTPNLGTPSAAVLTNATGTATGLTAGTATTANGVAAGVVAGKMIYDQFTATELQTTFTTSATYISGKVEVYANGVKMVNAADVTVTSGTSVVFTTGVALNTRVDLVYPT
jgi:bifunctional ADP-heptose synthase (sugar kinase/adenylyltransferase)